MKTAANLIVMATDGRHRLLESPRGGHSERVLRHAAAPMLTAPVGLLAGRYLG